MLETSARLLELLSLLQLRRDWTSSALADRLGVSTRTVRADIGKLRPLGYPVDARPGVAGGYRLAAGTAMPPLLLDDDEAVAVAVGLGVAATWRLGVEETSLTALAKLEQVMPSRLRRRVDAIRGATSVVPGAEPPLDLAALSTVASAIRGHERLRFGYTKPGGAEEPRHTEPQRLVSWGSVWYLLAWDLDRDTGASSASIAWSRGRQPACASAHARSRRATSSNTSCVVSRRYPPHEAQAVPPGRRNVVRGMSSTKRCASAKACSSVRRCSATSVAR